MLFAERRWDDESRHLLAEDILPAIAERRLGRRIELDDPALAIDRDDAVEGRLKDGALSRLGGGELGAALGIRERSGHQLGELRDALLGVERQGFAPVRDCHY